MSETTNRHILLLSGGKDSTALAIYMRDKHPEISMEYVFCDTHKELPETYEYLTRIESYLGKPVTKLASEEGDRGFDHFLAIYRGYLPSPQMRWCTRQLKIEPFEKYVGDDPVYLYVGIRADENREGFISTKPNITPLYPFREAGIIKEDVFRILQDSGVDLPKYYEWRSRSGCYFCFFQRKIEWVGLIERHPNLFEIAKSYEKPEQGYTWVQGESLEEISRTERIDEIRKQDAKRKEQLAKRRKPRTLAEMFSGEFAEEEDGAGCLICHL